MLKTLTLPYTYPAYVLHKYTPSLTTFTYASPISPISSDVQHMLSTLLNSCAPRGLVVYIQAYTVHMLIIYI